MPLLIELKSHEAWLMLETKSVHLLWLFWVNVKLIPNNVFNMLIYVKKIRSHFSLLFRIGFSIFLPHQSFVFQMTACNPCWHNNESMATWWIKFWRLNIFLLELGKLNKSCTYKRKMRKIETCYATKKLFIYQWDIFFIKLFLPVWYWQMRKDLG